MICRLYGWPRKVNVVQQMHEDGIEECVSLLKNTIEYSRWLE